MGSVFIRKKERGGRKTACCGRAPKMYRTWGILLLVAMIFHMLPMGGMDVHASEDCSHPAAAYTSAEAGKHTVSCPDCGWGGAEDCTYSGFTDEDGQNHKGICILCGGEKIAGHSWEYERKGDRHSVTIYNACQDCSHMEDMGTVTITGDFSVPYGQTKGLELAVTSNGLKIPLANLTWYCLANSGSLTPSIGITPTYNLPEDLAVGEYYYNACLDFSFMLNLWITVTVTPAKLTPDMVTVSPADATYNGMEQKPAVTVWQGERMLAAGTDYDIAYSTQNFTDAGIVQVTVTGKGNYTGEVTKEYVIQPATPAIVWGEGAQELTYTGQPAAITAPTVLFGDVVLDHSACQYSYAVDGTGNDIPGLPVDAGTYSVKASRKAQGNYTAAESEAMELTISKAEGILTVPEIAVEKTFGDAGFPLNCSTNGDGKISYVSDHTDVALISADGNVLITGAGNAKVTVSLAEGRNYTGAADQNVGIVVAKAAAPVSMGETRSYTYTNGSQGTVNIDVAGKLPKDRGETKYTFATSDETGILSGVSVEENGILKYTVEGNRTEGEEDTASVTVTAEMANYEDATYTVEILLVAKKNVELQEGSSVAAGGSNTLTYGEALSALTLDPAIFVEQGTDTTVAGTLAWKDGSIVPVAGTVMAEWVFTPEDGREYLGLTGTVEITVEKAVPKIKAPVADAITYHPLQALGSVGLKDGDATWMVNGNAVAVDGTWGWKDARMVPTAGNSGYTAVFTPGDTANYDVAECSVPVSVAKALPYIAAPPAAAPITYGDALDASSLTEGMVQYSSLDGTAVAGSFAWKDGSIKPAGSDGGTTKYTVVFIPEDEANYNSVETEITLNVELAEHAPDMPPAAMVVAVGCEKVGDVPLPSGWQWQEGDKNTVLDMGVAVTATAIYVGEDKGNYKNVAVTVMITRMECGHQHKEVRYAVAATCQNKGYSGDTYCLDCGELLAKGVETGLAGHRGGVATCVSGKICMVCKTEYTIKDSANHVHTEIQGQKDSTCTADGYTGNRFCTDCNTKISSGTVIPASGHDWQVTREEGATTISEGKRYYSCQRCGQTREENIPKLPDAGDGESGSDQSGDGKPEEEQPGDGKPEEIQPDDGKPEEEQPGDGKPEESQPNVGKPEEGQPDYGQPDGNDMEQNRPQAGRPFVKDKGKKEGWSAIRDEVGHIKDGGTVTIDMNGSAIVPGDMLEDIRGRDITTRFDMGNGIIWSVDGKDMKEGEPRDIDFSVKTDTQKIPAEAIDKITEGGYHIQVSLTHEGTFGFTAVLSIGLGKGNAGLAASLYYYNPVTKELELVSTAVVAEDGAAEFLFHHASDYLIVVDKETEGTSETGKTGENEENKESGITEGAGGTEENKEAERTEETETSGEMEGKDSSGTDTPQIPSPSAQGGDQGQLPNTDSQTFPWGTMITGMLLVAVGIACVVLTTKKKEG